MTRSSRPYQQSTPNGSSFNLYASSPSHYSTPSPTYHQVEASYWGEQHVSFPAQNTPTTPAQLSPLPFRWNSFSQSPPTSPPPAPRLPTVPLPPCTPSPTFEHNHFLIMPCLALASGSCPVFDIWGRIPDSLASIHIQPATEPACTSMTFTNPVDADLPEITIHPSCYQYVTIGDILGRVSSMRNPIPRDTYSRLGRNTRRTAKRVYEERVACGVGPLGVTALDALCGRRYFAGIMMDDMVDRWTFVILA
ncbi:hypothetical protein BDN72DRAFT_521769 [Pluteus cervinus]|uniref:Uncharacterized protein n=1 Tax=Pluteus cervinus TaxID=181527 RepID=A0ACD3AY47_9AGAR|nr:hypothetical protein BDN72DRAFT_521769 [Pluteus cervinus]